MLHHFMETVGNFRYKDMIALLNDLHILVKKVSFQSHFSSSSTFSHDFCRRMSTATNKFPPPTVSSSIFNATPAVLSGKTTGRTLLKPEPFRCPWPTMKLNCSDFHGRLELRGRKGHCFETVVRSRKE